MAKDTLSDMKPHTLMLLRNRERQEGMKGRLCVCVSGGGGACVCLSAREDVASSVACLQSSSVIHLHPHFLSPHCSSGLWLSQRVTETHCAGFILELTGECLR